MPENRVTMFLSCLLCRFPLLYRYLLNLRRPFNCEKGIYLLLLRRGMTIVELGANHGYFTRLFSSIVGSSGKVFAFEPVPKTRLELMKAISGRFSNVTVFPFALSDHSGETSMYVPGEIHGQASLRVHNGGGWGEAMSVMQVRVQQVRLDDVPEISSAPRIDFIKIDVEGAELLALRGAESILLRDHPILHLEVEHAWMKSFGYSGADLMTYLKGLGYQYFYSYDKHVHELDHLDCTAGFNLVCANFSLYHQ